MAPTLLTVEDEHYRWPMRLLDTVAGAASSVGLPLGHVDKASILKRAQRTTGLSDFGEPFFEDGFDELVAAAHGAKLTNLAGIMLRQAFIRAAQNRLWMEDYLKKNPGVLDVEVKRPIFVLGFPRTGTTVLQNLLCLDEGRRALKFWELITPVPTDLPSARDEFVRIRAAKRMLSAAYMVAPEMAEVHYIDAMTNEECWPLMSNAFTVLNYDLQSGLRGYGEWLMQRNMVASYREYKRYLQVLLSQRPAGQLVLKCPEHLWFVDALLEVFPDACIVWTHRDPVPTIASYCSLISMQWRTLYGRFNPHELGDHITQRFHLGVQRAMKARATADPKRFFDVNFHNLVTDYEGTVREISEYFGLPFHPEMPARIEGYLGNERADAKGKHKYSVERYGIDVDAVHRQYADYISSFAVSVKAA